MKLYLIEDNTNDPSGVWWDRYEGAVVVAIDENDAKTIHPDGTEYKETDANRGWVTKSSDILVTEIGEAKEGFERGVIFASYQSGG